MWSLLMLHNNSNESCAQPIDVFIFNFIHCIDVDVFVLKNDNSNTIYFYFEECKFVIIQLKNVQISFEL